ncbi:ATP-binding cassette domain-containing protein [Micrococcus porci]|uniref:ABC transporter ATP-binding protein n=1 Tax=Micrococcus porci TaxID=2856555 RepID=UPI001CCF26C9|nr:ATP-binding cassette domain-containing protein [Micrococcus porci]UBH24154.1 ATP-binding cassette domain-containing protein [Micrococcus porci]
MTDTTVDYALVLDRVSMTYRVPSSAADSVAALPAWRRGLARALRQPPRVPVHALHEMTLGLEQGRTLGLVGRNGSGKSTLSQIIAGKLAPSTGRVLATATPMMLGVNAALVPAMSGRQNIVLGCLALGMAKDEVMAKTPEIAASTGLGEAIDLPIETYSSGMSARLRFAIATSRDPEVLVIDEALNVGDSQFRARAKERMQELKRKAGAVVLVSHDNKTILDSSNKVLWLDKGRPVMEGSPQRVMDRYEQYNEMLAAQKVDEARAFVEDLRTTYRPRVVLPATDMHLPSVQEVEFSPRHAL